jgi:hypothetical protein
LLLAIASEAAAQFEQDLGVGHALLNRGHK